MEQQGVGLGVPEGAQRGAPLTLCGSGMAQRQGMKHWKVGQGSRAPQQQAKMVAMGLRWLPSAGYWGARRLKDVSPEPGGTCSERCLLRWQLCSLVLMRTHRF